MPLDVDPSEVTVAISALQHYSYCPRQCGLIHLEQSFDENLYTLRGRAVHERVDHPESELRKGLTVERALPIWSETLGLVGRADAVEFLHDDQGEIISIIPVEYKHGSRHKAIHDDIQVCAQALCLEEMFGVDVPRGAIFHHGSRRRRQVDFDEALRNATRDCVDSVRAMLIDLELPAPVADARCHRCSLRDSCLPFVVDRNAEPITEIHPSR